VVKLTDSDDYLLCPEPGCAMAEWTHIVRVWVMGRPHEDGPVTYRHVDMSAKVSPPLPDWPDDPFDHTDDRRDSVIIVGECEGGHEFAIHLRQNRGQTEVETKARGWR
jgi:hypothetical protein